VETKFSKEEIFRIFETILEEILLAGNKLSKVEIVNKFKSDIENILSELKEPSKEEIEEKFKNKITVPKAAKLFGMSPELLYEDLKASNAPRPISNIRTTYYDIRDLFKFIQSK
jgi:hypothetical protein